MTDNPICLKCQRVTGLTVVCQECWQVENAQLRADLAACRGENAMNLAALDADALTISHLQRDLAAATERERVMREALTDISLTNDALGTGYDECRALAERALLSATEPTADPRARAERAVIEAAKETAAALRALPDPKSTILAMDDDDLTDEDIRVKHALMTELAAVDALRALERERQDR